ncbi:tdrd9, partial [Symbiodinium necroappetens]
VGVVGRHMQWQCEETWLHAGYLSNELVVVNISDPLRLELVGSVQSDKDLLGPTGLALEGDLAFVALELSTLAVVNISDPQRPQIVGILDESSEYPYSYSVACDGELVYTLSYDSAALLVINVSTPSQPRIIGKVVDERLKGAGDLLLLGDIAWVVGADSSGLAAVNISLPTRPVVISAVQDATYLDGAYGIAAQGDFAYVAGYYSHSLAVINISDPQAPILLGAIKDKQHLYGAYSVTVDGDEAYVPCLDGKSVAIINISVPDSPELACVASEVIGGRYAARAGGYTYVPSYDSNSLLAFGAPFGREAKGRHGLYSEPEAVALDSDDLVSDYQDLLPGTVYSLVETAAEEFQRAWEDGDLESPSILEKLPALAVQLVPFFAKKDSTLLVFMPGLLELSNLSKMFTPEALKSFPTLHRKTSPSNYEVFVLHSMVPRSEQERVFQQPSDGKCHIVLASNIAESSITLLTPKTDDLSGKCFPEHQHPWRSARLSPMQSAPLLKFENERPKLCEEGLAVLEALPGPVCPIAFVGDGRSGKSFLASKLVGAGTFREDDSEEAVTEGIDIATMSCHPGHLLILDCEGGNNAMSKSHSIVTVVGALFATALIFVTDGKASEAAVEALGRMLEERALIKCDGTGSLQAQTLLFVVNQNRLRYGEDALEKILAADHGAERKEIRTLISNAYPEHRRQFFTIPVDNKSDFEDKWESFHGAMRNAAVPLKMGKLWMTGSQVVHMLRRVEEELRTRGKVSLPSLHRHVILDGWLKPTVGQVLQSRMDKLLDNFSQEELATQKVGSVDGSCTECQKSAAGWLDPDVEEFFCEDCWLKFSPKVLKCCFCGNFHPWILGRVEKVTKMWHCNDCLMQLGIEIPHAEFAPRVTAVIDFALRREPVYDHNQGLTCLTTSWCSQASARQRSGRAGRTQPGIAIRLVTRSFFEEKMPEFDTPEILRTSTAKLFLRAKKLSQVLQKAAAKFSPDCPLDLRSARSLIGSLPQPPKMKLLKAAVKELAQTSALAAADEAAEITSLGYFKEQLVAEIEMLRGSASITAEEEAPMTHKGTEEPAKENPAEMLVANVANYGEFSEDPFSEDSIIFSCPPPDLSLADAGNVERDPEEKHDDDPPSFLPISTDHASQGSWMGARPYDDEACEPLAEPSAEPVADAFVDAVHEKVFELTQPTQPEEKVLAELPGTVSEADYSSTDAVAAAAEEPGTKQEQISQLEAPEPKDSDLHCPAQVVGTTGSMDGVSSAVLTDVATEAKPGVVKEEHSHSDGVTAEGMTCNSNDSQAESMVDFEGYSRAEADIRPEAAEAAAAPEADLVDSMASAEQPGDLQADSQEVAELREHILELQAAVSVKALFMEAVASKDQTLAAQQQMLEGKSNDLKARLPLPV